MRLIGQCDAATEEAKACRLKIQRREHSTSGLDGGDDSRRFTAGQFMEQAQMSRYLIQMAWEMAAPQTVEDFERGSVEMRREDQWWLVADRLS